MTRVERRAFIEGTLALLAAPLAAGAQQAKVARLGFLGISPASAYASRIEGLRHGLRELGYIEGKNISIEWRYADSKAERLPDLAIELGYVEGRKLARGEGDLAAGLGLASEAVLGKAGHSPGHSGGKSRDRARVSG
jgi:hypothetical protein